MKLTFVIDSLAIGGAQKHLRQLSVGLANRGHRVEVICLNDVCHPVMASPMVEAGIRLTVIGRRAMLCGVGFWRLVQLLRRTRPDLLVTILFASTVAGRLAAAVTGGLKVVTCVQARNINYRWWQFLLLRLTAGWSRKFVFNSRSAIPFACDREGASTERCVYVANGVEAPLSREQGARVSWIEHGLPFQDDDEIVGTIGRLDPQKGFADLLRVFAPLAVKRPRARLLIVGAGSQEAKLRALVRELDLSARVCFAGERTDCAAFLGSLTVYVQPSIFEGTPNALMEAMAAGVPTVATAVDGTMELIENGVTGWLVPAQDREVLLAALLAVLETPEKRKVVAARGRQEIFERFPLGRMIDDYAKVFEALARDEPAAVCREKA